MVEITRDQYKYIQGHTQQEVFVTVVNRQANARKKNRFIAEDDNVKHLLLEYQQDQEKKTIARSN